MHFMIRIRYKQKKLYEYTVRHIHVIHCIKKRTIEIIYDEDVLRIMCLFINKKIVKNAFTKCVQTLA